MSAQVTTETWDAAWVTTGRVRRKRINDQINNSNPTLEILRASNRVEFEDGGKEIQEDLTYANGTMQWFSDWDELNTDEPDNATSSFWPWRYAVVPCAISLTKEREARLTKDGPMNLMELKTVTSRNTINTGINAAIWAAQSGKSMLGFQDLIKADPTVGSLGGIPQATSSWFRNKYSSSSTNFNNKTGDTYDGLVAIGALYEDASDGNDEVDFIALGSTLYSELLDIFEGTGYARLEADRRNSPPHVGAGRQTPKGSGGPAFRGASFYKDRDVPAQSAYGFNSKYVKLKIMRGVNFAKTPFVQGQNQLGKVSFMIVGIQMVMLQPRRCFVHNALT